MDRKGIRKLLKTMEICSNFLLKQQISDLMTTPSELFAASLDGQKIYDRMYANGILPKEIRGEGIEDLYAQIFPHIANLVCAYPPVVEQWKMEGFKDGFRRLDEIANTLGNVANKLDLITSKETNTSDKLLIRVRQTLLQRVQFQLELSGLRGDRPDAVPLEKCFIVPEFCHIMADKEFIEPEYIRKGVKIGNENEIFNSFVGISVRKLIIGTPGSGKSTWSRWFQKLQLTSKEPRLAFLVRLRDLIKNDTLPSHQQIVRDEAGTHFREEVDSTTVRNWCESGLISFILDGFDEIPPTKRDSVLEWIRELEVAIGKAGLILTSRPITTSHLEKLSESWQRWELLAFDEQRITDYITCWYAYAPVLNEKTRKVDAAYLAKTWVEDVTLRPFIGTPLMLATILMVHHMDGELPRGRAKLYERYIDGMLGLWDSRWGVISEIDLTLELKKRILTCLALQFFIDEIEQIGDLEIEKLLDDVLPNLRCAFPTPIVLNYLRERTGLLIGPGTWSFVHKNIGEFLVASAIRDGDLRDNDGQKFDRLRLYKERHNDRWNAVLFFWAGLTGPGDLQSFIEQVESEQGNNDFALALSLIYDQLQPHRLTESWVRSIFLRLIKRGFQARGSEPLEISIGSGPHKINTDIKAKSIRMRSLENVHLLEVIIECLKICKFDLQQVSDCDESLRFYIWIYFAIESENIEDVNSTFSNKSWKRPIPVNWMLLGIECRIKQEVASGNFKQFIELLYLNIPEHAGKVLFILLARFISDYETGRDLRKSNINIIEYLNVINLMRNYKVNEEWLNLSREFKMHGESGDVLKNFLTVLDKTIQNKLIKDDDLISTIRAYITELKNKRIEYSQWSKRKVNQIAATTDP